VAAEQGDDRAEHRRLHQPHQVVHQHQLIERVLEEERRPDAERESVITIAPVEPRISAKAHGGHHQELRDQRNVVERSVTPWLVFLGYENGVGPKRPETRVADLTKVDVESSNLFSRSEVR
jgi:hypothetical protein